MGGGQETMMATVVVAVNLLAVLFGIVTYGSLTSSVKPA